MRPSYLISTDPKHLPSLGAVDGAALLGVIGKLAYAHIAPEQPPRRFVNAQLTGGVLTFERELGPDEPAPDGAPVLVVGERPPFPWGDDYTVVYDPAPAAFQWATFAAAKPTLAAQLLPHEWAGEADLLSGD